MCCYKPGFSHILFFFSLDTVPIPSAICCCCCCCCCCYCDMWFFISTFDTKHNNTMILAHFITYIYTHALVFLTFGSTLSCLTLATLAATPRNSIIAIFVVATITAGPVATQRLVVVANRWFWLLLLLWIFSTLLQNKFHFDVGLYINMQVCAWRWKWKCIHTLIDTYISLSALTSLTHRCSTHACTQNVTGDGLRKWARYTYIHLCGTKQGLLFIDYPVRISFIAIQW